MATFLMLFAYYIGRITTRRISYIIALSMLIAPSITSGGKHLYFSFWSLLIPFLLMAWLTQSEKFKSASLSTKARYAFIIALLSLFIKCMFYFEFLSSSLVIALLPLLYWLFCYENQWRSFLKLFCFASCGALLGSALVMLFKITLEAFYWGDLITAFESTYANIANRTMSDGYSIYNHATFTTELGVVDVLKLALKIDAISLVGITSINNFTFILCACVGSFCLACVWVKNKEQLLRKDYALALTTWLALIAPCSWIILAHNHAALHPRQCDAVWYLSFHPFAIALLCVGLIRLYHSVKLS